MSVGLKGVGGFNSSVTAWFRAVEKASAATAVGLAKRVFDKVLVESPQYSGDFTANWKVTVGAPAPASAFQQGVLGTRYSAHKGDDGLGSFVPYQRGDEAAIAHAQANATWNPIKLGQSIFISNSASHDEHYAWQIENGVIKFRPVNAGAGVVGRRSVAFVQHLFPHIGKSQFEILRRVGT